MEALFSSAVFLIPAIFIIMGLFYPSQKLFNQILSISLIIQKKKIVDPKNGSALKNDELNN